MSKFFLLNIVIIQSTKPLTNQSYIIANFDAFAFYRVNYDNQNWDTIIKQLTTLKNVDFFRLFIEN